MTLSPEGTTRDALVVTATPKQGLPVNLVGKDYVIQAPKSAFALKMGAAAKSAKDDPMKMLEGLYSWVDAAFTKKDATAVKKRLDSPTDDLDISHIVELMNAVVEHQTGNPTS